MTIEELDFNKLFPNEVFHQDNVWTLHHMFNGDVNKCYYSYNACLVGIIQDDPTELAVGISCCSPKDQYEKKLARNIAYARAYITPVYFSLEPLINKFIDHNMDWRTSSFEKDMYRYTRELVANGTLTFKDFNFNYLYQYLYPVYGDPRLNCYTQKLFNRSMRNIGKRDKEIIDFYNSLI